jgi:antitoxin component YwqK of YwqJK toxin-antitoxin module
MNPALKNGEYFGVNYQALKGRVSGLWMTQITVFLLFLCTGCSSPRSTQSEPELVSLHIVDREGMTEAIANPERLQSYTCVNFLDPQPYQKVLRVYSKDQEGVSRAYITAYHPNGQVKQYLESCNGRANGFYREWYPNGGLKVEGRVIEGIADLGPKAEKTWVFDGMTKAYSEEGALVAEIPYCRGAMHGFARYFHSNGAIWKEVPYENNLIQGFFNLYLNDGTLLQTSCYSQGSKEGEALRYWPDGSIASRENYSKGRLLEAAYLDQGGRECASIRNGEGWKAVFGKEEVSELQEFHGGVQEGLVQVFDKEGALLQTYRMKQGLKHGEEVYYFPCISGEKVKPKLSINWNKGKVQGVVKTWYPSGGMQSQREMSENKKTGLFTHWYLDGQLMMIEEYEQDKLFKGDYFRKGNKKPVSQVSKGDGIATLFDEEGNFLKKVAYKQGHPDDS